LERLADAVGISIAVTALAAELAFFIRLQFTEETLAVLYGLALLDGAAGAAGFALGNSAEPVPS
jgi:hypothetical protein